MYVKNFSEKSVYIRFLLIFVFSGASLYADIQEKVNFGVLSLAPPTKIYTSWKPFAKYLAKETGLKVNIVAPRGFKKLKKMASEKKVDIFYVNSLIFYRLKQSNRAIAIAQMQNIANQITSQSDIFVRADSNITNISELKDKTIAFVSPMGAGGYLAPKAYLYQQGLNADKETKEVFTKNLTNSIYNVLLGKVDAATMCGVNYQLMSKKLETGELKVIASSTKYPENVLAARVGLSSVLIAKLKKAIINMPSTIEGRRILKGMKVMKIKQFIPYDESLEKLTRNLLKSAKFND
ncbi:phosphate/phosphite/phosphonate ABC transporter substrate-binding protein [Sulfurimonas sp. MAG313]|nr:phosphate/phosphite/phosphonate ABC transporter substrate-binding protein [Sulfurimonas sp. MAG313]MDF1880738.1 phosphate/phosphite/phosphonate ABC transporter substrate-binding protein [Sulfurimonas sp. MAG313]